MLVVSVHAHGCVCVCVVWNVNLVGLICMCVVCRHNGGESVGAEWSGGRSDTGSGGQDRREDKEGGI